MIFVLSDQPSLRSPLPALWDFLLRKGAHVTEYAVLAYLLTRAMDPAVRARRAAMAAFILSVLYAGSDEAHQAFVAGRQPAGTDIVVDAVGAWIGISAVRFRARRFGGGPPEPDGSAGKAAGPT